MTIVEKSYSFELSGPEDAANVTEVSEQKTEDLCRPPLMVRAELLKGRQLSLHCLQTGLEHVTFIVLKVLKAFSF